MRSAARGTSRSSQASPLRERASTTPAARGIRRSALGVGGVARAALSSTSTCSSSSTSSPTPLAARSSPPTRAPMREETNRSFDRRRRQQKQHHQRGRRQSPPVLPRATPRSDGDGGGTSPSPPPPSPASASTPTQPPYEYHDTLSDVLFIALCRISYGRLAGFQSTRDWKDGIETYKGMVEVSRALMTKLPKASQQSAAVIAGFPRVAPWFRKLFPYSKWGAEANAKITPAFFGWLVGPAKVKEETIVDFRNNTNVRSVVRIERCRYLAESGCVGMCVNLCRTPVQQFFGDELGVPLRITPCFEDFSCEFHFGKEAANEEEDEILRAPCLRECVSVNGGADGGGRCPKLEG